MKKVKTNKRAGIHKFSIALMVIAIIGFIYSTFSMFSFLITLLYYLIAGMVLIVSLFTVNWLENGEVLANFTNALYDSVPYVIYVVLAFSLVSLLIYIFSKKIKNKTAGIVTNSIIIALSVVILIFNLLGYFRMILN